MNPNDPFAQMRYRVARVSWWQVALGLTVALAIGVALALVAASVFLVVAPVVLIAGLAYKLFGAKGSGGPRATQGRSGVTVIDAEYRVLSPEEIRHDGGPRRPDWR